MMRIPLTQGKTALVDDGDYERVSQRKWYANNQHGHWYAVSRFLIVVEGKITTVSMHRFILGVGGDHIDHINHNGLDNRRSNIRRCSRQENYWNSRPTRGSTSRYKGVSWNKGAKKWAAQIVVNCKTIWLGYFMYEALAALAYDFAAMKYHREFANFNF